MTKMKPTLGQVFALSLLGLTAVLALLFTFVFNASRATIMESSERLRASASGEIAERVSSFLTKAPDAVEQFQVALDLGLVDPSDPRATESALFGPLLSDGDISEVTLTYGKKTGVESEGWIQLAASARGQWSAVRSIDANGDERFWSRHVYQEGDHFVADRRECGRTLRFAEQPMQREGGGVSDPTIHDTFTGAARRANYGNPLWSDLHEPQLNPGQGNAEVSVQQVVTDAAGEFVGVLRVGLLTQQLDRAVQLTLTPDSTPDPHRIFLCDTEGRLITRIAPGDALREYEDEALRFAPEKLPPEVAGALALPSLRTVGEDIPVVSGHFRHAGAEFLTTFRAFPKPKTQDWIVGIVVPRSFYLGKLTEMRDRLLLVSLGIMLALLAIGGLILRAVKRAQAQIARESMKMNRFDFSPASTAAPFRDVSYVLESLEQAKTAMRSMGKYVPIDLVRRLYHEKSEPALGADAMDISIMFTDIKNFATISEQLDADVLAVALGRYLDSMTRIIQQETRGTIDKYIGDSIMTIWNAPEPVPDHPRMACLAALRCRAAARALWQSPDWSGLPPFDTRFGLHRDTERVGHFGAPDRMNYTAIGDGVNLASRLEGLNKQYGTSIIVSEAIAESARDHFDFRLLDLVAVKGKTRAVRIYELLGNKGECGNAADIFANYEKAFVAYTERDFAGAIAILQNQNGDPPSAVLAERCRAFLEEPPPADWRGVYAASEK
jgi:adenylate cyclase